MKWPELTFPPINLWSVFKAYYDSTGTKNDKKEEETGGIDHETRSTTENLRKQNSNDL